MFEGNDYHPTTDELRDEIRELHFELSVSNDRLIKAFQMIADLSELVEETNLYMADAVEDIYAQARRLDDSKRNRKK